MTKEKIKHFPVPGTKIVCRKCGNEKDESLFDLSRSNLSGRSYQCKDCRAKYGRARLEKKKPGVRRAGEGILSPEEKQRRKRDAQRTYRTEHRDEVNLRARTGSKKRRKE